MTDEKPRTEVEEDSAYGLLTRFCESRGWKMKLTPGQGYDVDTLFVVTSSESESEIRALCVVTDKYAAYAALSPTLSTWSVLAKFPDETVTMYRKYLNELLGQTVQWLEGSGLRTEKFPNSDEELDLGLAARGY